MIRVLLWCLFLPVQLLLLVTFLVLDFFHSLLRRIVSPPPPALREIRNDRCSIVILNWNGRHLLEESIPPLLSEVRRSGKDHEIIIVDNGSSDDSVPWIRKNYPEISVLELEENLGFGEGNNRGVEKAKHDIVVLLNNDMIVAKGFLEPLLEAFSSPGVFAVSSQIFFPEGKRREETGNTRASIQNGYLNLSHEKLERYRNLRPPLPVFWAGGGSSAFHREGFLLLGGFSKIYSPCYLEDTDLSYRAWRRGWKVLLAPESQVVHKHRSSSKIRFGKSEIQSLVEERKLWYLWSNLQFRTNLSHFLLFPIHLTRKLQVSQYLRALKKLPSVLLCRLSEPRRMVTDRMMANWIRHPLSYLDRFFPGRRNTPASGTPLKILYVSAYLPHLGTHGGAGRVYQLLKRASQKHQVSLICFVEDQREFCFQDQVKGYCRRIATVVRNHFEPISFFPHEPFEEFNSWEFRSKLETMLTEEDYDIIHFEWTQMALYADLCRAANTFLTEIEVNWAACRTTLTVESSRLMKFIKSYKMLHTLYREVEMCRRVDQVICVTDKDKEYLEPYLKSTQLSVINTGVDTEYFDHYPGIDEPKSLLFVGAFRHSPNVDAMRYFCQEIFPRILEDEPDVRLYIVGATPTREIEHLGQMKNITVTGYVEDIRGYYHRAQIVVVPLRTGVGIRGKILEAWSVGKATVATSLACQGIRAGHGESVILADTAEDFSMWTTALLRNPDFCQELGRQGRNTVEKFYDWDVISDRLLNKYEEVVGIRR